MATEAGLREPTSPRRFDMRTLWRLTGWGFAAALSLGVLAAVTQTDTGSRRLQMAMAPADLPVHAVAVVKVPPPTDKAELAQLKAQLRELTADRDRLGARVAGLERNLDDLTGSIKKQVEAAAAKPEKPATPPPAVATPPVIAPLAMAPGAGEPASWPGTPHEADAAHEVAAAAAPQPAERAEPAPPRQSAEPTPPAPAHEAVPLPPVRMAALPPKPGFGIALAGASNLALLHMQWAALKANFRPLLGELKPHVLRERRGTATHYRLIVGPMPTYTAAARLCARLIHARAVCHPVKMAGEPL